MRNYGISRGMIVIPICLAMLLILSGACKKAAPESLSGAELEGRLTYENTAHGETEKPASGDNTPVSRAMAAKMLAMIYNDRSSIDDMERIISFSDTSLEKWYDRFINACFKDNLMKGGGGEFRPEDLLTLEEARVLLGKISDNAVKPQITDENKNKPVSYALWTELFIQALCYNGKDLASYGIEKREIILLATSENNKKLKDGNSITSDGPITHLGIYLGDYIDEEITVLKKGGEIIAVLGIASATPTVKNAYIVRQTETAITIFSGGAERTYECSLPKAKSVVCDVSISKKRVMAIKERTDTKTSMVKRIGNGFIELSDGTISCSEQLKVYSTADGAVKWKDISDIVVGSDIAVLYLDEAEVCSAVITKKAQPEYIRVLISTSGYNGYVHKSVSITSDKDFLVITGGVEALYKAGEIYQAEAQNAIAPEDFARVTIKPQDGGLLQITSIKRNWSGNESPKYKGIIEVGQEQDGYSIVNELGFEEYLYAVVPSEMPSSYGLEAAKVQAVSARSFAYNQFYQNRYHKYGANVDDSVMCQVYNNIPENANSIAAVDATAGICLTYGGAVVSANFFSTSAGVTANSGEVWSAYGGKLFPAETPEYLQSVSQLATGSIPDLTVENNAYDFFKNTSIDSYDSQFDWFRWNVEMTGKELSASINMNIEACYKTNPNHIKTLQPDGKYKSVPVSNIGEVKNIEVLRRGEGGNIMSLKIIGTKATVIAYTELNIRYLIRPVQYLDGQKAVMTNRNGGNGIENYSLMPSAFFAFDKQETDGLISKICFYGGGNGHGVGMSQNGVKGMIDIGKGFEEILEHFYPGTKLVKVID